jgi:hypothetical protein
MWSFQSKWLTHEIEHHVQHLPMTAMDEYVDAVDNKELPGGIEHQLLHAVDHVQLFVTIFSDLVSLFAPSALFFHFTSVALPCATFETPFRPPRFSIPLI